MWVHSPDGQLCNLARAVRVGAPTMTSHATWFIAAVMPEPNPPQDLGPFEGEYEAKSAFSKIVEGLKAGEGFVVL